MTWLPYLLLSVLSAFGAAVVLVEKKRDWPIRRWHLRILYILQKIHPRLKRMLSCTVCTSFWATLITDILICIFSGFRYWCWPLSGFVTVGLTWFIFDFLNTIDRRLLKDREIEVQQVVEKVIQQTKVGK